MGTGERSGSLLVPKKQIFGTYRQSPLRHYAVALAAGIGGADDSDQNNVFSWGESHRLPFGAFCPNLIFGLS